jgi:hypothetical protein
MRMIATGSLCELFNMIYEARKSRSSFEHETTRFCDVLRMHDVWTKLYKTCSDEFSRGRKAAKGKPFDLRDAVQDFTYHKVDMDERFRLATWGALNKIVESLRHKADDGLRIPPAPMEGSESTIHPIELYELGIRGGEGPAPFSF